jgi:periplasmic protein TonB
MTGVRRPFRVTGSAAASLGINALLIAALLNLGMGRAPRREEGAALTVMSLAALKGVEQGAEQAEAAQATAQPEAPVPTQVPPPTPVSPPQPVPPPMVAIPSALSLPVAVAPAAPSTPAAAAAPSSQPAARAAPVMAASAGAPPARRGIADGLNANAPAGNSRAYAARVRSWLYAHKIYPRRARMRHEEGVVKVRFVIDRAGMLIEGRVISSSGRASLDEEAAAMLHRASPYPKAPADISGDRIEFTAPVEFVLPV